MTIFLILLSFFIGTAVGSFINALVYRLRHNLPIIIDRSICPHCKKPIKNIDLIPVVSYLVLGGKCRACGNPISPQYPIVEIVTGLLFAATFYQYFGPIVSGTLLSLFSFATQLLFVTILMTLLLYDLKYLELPDRVVLPSLVAALFINAAKVGLAIWGFRENTLRLPFGEDLLADSQFFWGHAGEIASPYLYGALAGLGLAVVFYLIVLISKERAMGGGDIKLAMLLGLILPWPYLIPALYIGFLLGAAIGVVLVLARRRGTRELIPLAPFLVTGTIAAMFFGDELFRYLISVKIF